MSIAPITALGRSLLVLAVEIVSSMVPIQVVAGPTDQGRRSPELGSGSGAIGSAPGGADESWPFGERFVNVSRRRGEHSAP